MQTDLESKLAAEIKQKLDNKNTDPISIKALTDFDWDKLFIFNPYTPNAVLENALGEESQKLKKVEMYSREDINLLVFVNDSKIVSFIEFPRLSGDFDKVYRKEGFTPDNSNFIVTIEDRGEPWVTVLEAK